MTDPPAYGTADHARLITFGRHPDVQTAMAWLAFSHLPPALKGLCSPIYEAACALLRRIPNDSTELTTALKALVGAKDWFVRAGIRSDEGTPGPVPRPAAVVDPPSRFETAAEIVGGNYGPGQARPRPIKDWPQA